MGSRRHGATFDPGAPLSARRPFATTVELTLDKSAMALPVVEVPEPKPVSQGALVEVSSEWQGREKELAKQHITDGNFGTIWATEEKAGDGWVIVDLRKEYQVEEIMLSDAPYGRTQAFDIEAQVGGEWKRIAEGRTIGNDLNLSFPPVKARKFRLNIRKASDVPTLAEFQVFECKLRDGKIEKLEVTPKSRQKDIRIISREITLGSVLTQTASDVKGGRVFFHPNPNLSLPYSQLCASLEWVGPVVAEPDRCVFCCCPIEGPDGKIHMFVTRGEVGGAVEPTWGRTTAIAHYVADKPEGPFVYESTILEGTHDGSWESAGPQNPDVRLIDGRYVLVYTARMASP